MPVQLGSLMLFDVVELRKKFNLHPVTVRRLIARGKLRGQKMGRKWYVSEEAIRDYFNGPRRTPQEAPAKAEKGRA